MKNVIRASHHATANRHEKINVFKGDIMLNVRTVTEYSISGKRGGYRLQWIKTENKPSWIIGKNNTFGWYKYKKDAMKYAEVYNRSV